MTYDENGGYPHPDHVRTHEISIYARDAAADPARYPDAGPAWRMQKTYYDQIFNAPRIQAIYEVVVERDPDGEMVKQMDEMRRLVRPPDVDRRRTFLSAISSRCATARFSRTRARFRPTARSSAGRTSCSARSGRPRISNSPTSVCRPASRDRPVRGRRRSRRPEEWHESVRISRSRVLTRRRPRHRRRTPAYTGDPT